MFRNIISIMFGLAILFSVIFLSNPLISCLAGEDNLNELKQQVELLKKRIDVLEAAKTDTITATPSGSGLIGSKNTQTWDPFEEMLQMQQEMSRMFKNSFNWGGLLRKGMYSSDVFYNDQFGIQEDRDKYTIEFDMTGYDQGKIDIQINAQLLTIKGERSEDKSKENKSQYFNSQSYASFIRSIVIPADADTAKMKSERKEKKLIITLPKKKV